MSDVKVQRVSLTAYNALYVHFKDGPQAFSEKLANAGYTNILVGDVAFVVTPYTDPYWPEGVEFLW